ncbi:endonuclease 8-like 2 [Octodon degus]|uniref:Endonuclease 8-like 2 n=1 Tax=Octodon degus TaxID=10160 RepID=A0A6P6EDH8_OCTDE|nr:endonuclease 8-like 2 [Octodon degus]
MPEGPSVRKFHHLASAFVGQQVVKTGGSSKKLCPATLQFLWLQDTQVSSASLVCGLLSPTISVPPLEFVPASHVLPAELLSRGPGGPDGLTGNSPAAGAQRWLQVSFGLFGSIWVNEFSRAKKANKRGDWRDPAPRLVLHFDGGGFLAFYNCQMAWSPTAVAEPCRDILSEEAASEASMKCRHGGMQLECSSSSFISSQPPSRPLPRVSAQILLPCPDVLCPGAWQVTELGSPWHPPVPFGQPQFAVNFSVVCYTKCTLGLLSPSPGFVSGNIIKNEALYRARIHPLSLGSLLSPSCLETLVAESVSITDPYNIEERLILAQGFNGPGP